MPLKLTDVPLMRVRVPSLIAQLRAGAGPVLIEAKVVRIDPHSNSDDHRKYRSADSILEAARKDPILIAERSLIENEILDAREISRMREDIREEVDRVASAVDARPFPGLSHLMDNIFAPELAFEEDANPSRLPRRAHHHDRCHQSRTS